MSELGQVSRHGKHALYVLSAAEIVFPKSTTTPVEKPVENAEKVDEAKLQEQHIEDCPPSQRVKEKAKLLSLLQVRTIQQCE